MDLDNIQALLTADIKKKKELSGISESIVEREIHSYLKNNRNAIEILKAYQNEKQLERSGEYEKIIKTVRKKLHDRYGMFQILENSKEAADIKSGFLRKLGVRQETEKDYESILSLHLSTKERSPYYSFIYKQIFKKTGRPKTILDLGCGLNPVSAHYIDLKNLNYIASDIDRSNLEFISQYFKLSGISGKTMLLNLEYEKDVQKLAFIEADICFMFKLLELDKRLAESIITSVSAKYVVASFSTVSLTGKLMSNPERDWLEKLLHRLNYKFSVFKTENEIFYIIRK